MRSLIPSPRAMAKYRRNYADALAAYREARRAFLAMAKARARGQTTMAYSIALQSAIEARDNAASALASLTGAESRKASK